MKKVTLTFHDDAVKIIPYLHQMREGSFPFIRTDQASRAISNGLYGHGSKRTLAQLDWDWNIRFKAHHSPDVNHDRRRKLEISIMVRESDLTLLRLMLDGLDFTVYDEPFHQQKEVRRRTSVYDEMWSFPKLDLPDVIF